MPRNIYKGFGVEKRDSLALSFLYYKVVRSMTQDGCLKFENLRYLIFERQQSLVYLYEISSYIELV